MYVPLQRALSCKTKEHLQTPPIAANLSFCMYVPTIAHNAHCLANTLENLQTPPSSVTVQKYLSGQWRRGWHLPYSWLQRFF